MTIQPQSEVIVQQKQEDLTLDEMITHRRLFLTGGGKSHEVEFIVQLSRMVFIAETVCGHSFRYITEGPDPYYEGQLMLTNARLETSVNLHTDGVLFDTRQNSCKICKKRADNAYRKMNIKCDTGTMLGEFITSIL